MTEFAHWSGTARADGVRVEMAPVPTAAGKESWIVVAPGKFPILFCPCCGWPMESEHKAKLVADGIYPLAADPRAAYRDDGFPERKCDRCGQLYRGPAVYCCFECAVADA